MSRDTDPASAAPARHPLGLYPIIAIVLLWNCAYKGGRVANTLLALDLGAAPLDTGLLLATYGVFPLLLAIVTGRIADRYGVRVPVVVGTIVTAVGVLLPLFWQALPMLFLSAAVSGVGFILTQVSMQALVGSLGAGPERTRNLNTYSLVVSTSDLLGPVLAGFSIDQYGHLRAFVHLVLPGIVAALLAIFFAGRFPRAGAAAAGGLRTLDLFAIRDLRRMFIASALVMGGLDLFQLYLPIYGHSIGLSASAIGMILGTFAAASFLTRALLPALTRRLGEEPLLRYAMFLAAGTFFLIPQLQHGLALGATCFVLGLGMGLGQPLTTILTYNYAPAGRQGESLGTRVAINNTMHVSVPAVFGALGSLLGLAPVFWLSSAVLVAGGCAARGRRAAP
jgi:MFS family permease